MTPLCKLIICDYANLFFFRIIIVLLLYYLFKKLKINNAAK